MGVFQQMSAHLCKKRPRLPSNLAANICSSLVVVPGIGTPSAQLWKSGGDSIWPHQISRKLGSTSTYFAWWDHGLTDSKLLSWDNLSRSAHRLLHALLSVISCAKSKPCPVILIGHSLGGILVKEVRFSCVQNVQGVR
jgi:pimeloyl-ACP methyl ester carboxylesterase